VKLDIPASTRKEVMNKIIMRDELNVKKHHVPFFAEKERVIVTNHFASYPWYHRSENDCFMYSLPDMDKYETQNNLMEEQSIDLMCMLDDISYMDDLPKYDQYDDEYIKDDSSKYSTTYVWDEEA
jgi:hypothetical protein